MGESESGIMTTKPRTGVGYLIVYSDMQDSPAFNAMRPLAQLLVMKAKRFYDRKTQGPVRISDRTAAKLTGTTMKTARSLCREAVHYGCWRKNSAGYLGSNGKGIAASYQLTDEMFRGQPATLDFLRWDGTSFHEQHTPAYYKRKERSLTRLKALNARKLGSPEKTESRCRHTPNPAVDTHLGPAVDTHLGSSKVQQNPAVDTHPISREKLSISTAAEPVGVSQSVPEPAWAEPTATLMAPEPDTGLNYEGDDMSDSKQEQDLAEMLTVLRTYFGNRATSTAWYRHMQDFCGSGWSKPSFKRRLKMLKERRLVGIVGNPDADLERAPVGSLFEATEIAPGASQPLGSGWVPESAAMNGAADDAAKAAVELLERLNKGKTAA
jgi:hypothetical protein